MSLREELRNSLCSALGEIEASYVADAAVEQLRDAAPQEDADGQPLWPETTPEESSAAPADAGENPEQAGRMASDSGEHEPRRGVRFPHQHHRAPRPPRAEIEARLAQMQCWIAQRQPYVVIRDQAALLWGMRSDCTLRKYLRVARSRMVEELVEDRWMHQAEQIYALMDVARRAADNEQFSAAVGAHRVIAEIAGLLRAPLKPPEGGSAA
jgi:hypothetical protein